MSPCASRFDAVAVEEARLGSQKIRIEIALKEFRISKAYGLIEQTVERHQVRRAAGKELLIALATLQSLRSEKIVAGKFRDVPM